MEFRVSEKGAVSVYYLNRFPFTLYAEEWAAVFDGGQVILRFIAAHHLQLSCRCNEDTRQAVRDLLARGDLGNETRVGLLWCRKSQKGAVSLYGVRRRFPLTLYCDQWLRVLEAQDEIKAFIDEKRDRLSTKGCTVATPRKTSICRPLREVIGLDNIIRPVAVVRSYQEGQLGNR